MIGRPTLLMSRLTLMINVVGGSGGGAAPLPPSQE
jgi:hypothetical protein